jgi:hypothetical protein
VPNGAASTDSSASSSSVSIEAVRLSGWYRELGQRLVPSQEGLVLQPRACRLPHACANNLLALRLQGGYHQLGERLVPAEEAVVLRPRARGLPHDDGPPHDDVEAI